MLTSSYKRYALIVMTTAFAVSLLDRGFMFILLQSIKTDLQLSDTQVGFVTGIAFAIFYATMGIPIARWADRGHRVTIVALAMALWSLTALACAFVTNYVQLLIARIAAGIGDSGCLPPMYSLLGDYFPEPAERTRAMYVFDFASPMAGLATFVGAGWLNEHYGWRTAMLLAAIPGLLMAIVVRFSLIEPPRRAVRVRAQSGPPLKQILAMMWQQRSCRNLTIGTVVMFTLGQGVVAWQAAFMIRNHGIGTAELGMWMALIHTLGSGAGLLLGAYTLRRWFTGNEKGQMRLAALTMAATVPFYIAFLLLPKNQALLALVPQSIMFSAFITVVFVLLQRLVPDEVRATVFMVTMFFANLIGMGLGPQVVGILSDVLRPVIGRDALREAMLLVSFLGFWAAYHFWP